MKPYIYIIIHTISLLIVKSQSFVLRQECSTYLKIFSEAYAGQFLGVRHGKKSRVLAINFLLKYNENFPDKLFETFKYLVNGDNELPLESTC